MVVLNKILGTTWLLCCASNNQYCIGMLVYKSNFSTAYHYINHIFSHSHNWDVYRYEHRDELRDIEIKEAEKMLRCEDLGYHLYCCPGCGELKVVHFGCNSRVCTYCGKKFTDRWTDSTARKTFDVKHHHVVLTIPEELRSIFYEDRALLKVLMDCAICTVSDVIEWRLNYKATPRIVVVW